MDTLKPLLDLLSGQFGWLATVIAWLSALKLASTFWSAAFKRWASNQLNRVAADVVSHGEAETDDDYLRDLFSTNRYRLIGFVLRLIGFPLPSLADLERAIALQREAAAVAAVAKPQSSNLGSVVSLLLLASTLLLAAGCRELAPDGVYKGDPVLYHAELSITTSYDVVSSFVKWEKANRAVLAPWPEVARGASHLRQHYPQWHFAAVALRDAYAGDPTAENRTRLETALATLQTALSQASALMASDYSRAPE